MTFTIPDNQETLWSKYQDGSIDEDAYFIGFEKHLDYLYGEAEDEKDYSIEQAEEEFIYEESRIEELSQKWKSDFKRRDECLVHPDQGVFFEEVA